MRIDQILSEADEPSFSFEFFPPKSDAGERVLGLALESLRQLEPSFVSVTY
ncbi:MAG: methylenetetrahydrofolate reductase, partial [Solirubrobacteraceae bacterium]